MCSSDLRYDVQLAYILGIDYTADNKRNRKYTAAYAEQYCFIPEFFHGNITLCQHYAIDSRHKRVARKHADCEDKRRIQAVKDHLGNEFGYYERVDDFHTRQSHATRDGNKKRVVGNKITESLRADYRLDNNERYYKKYFDIFDYFPRAYLDFNAAVHTCRYFVNFHLFSRLIHFTINKKKCIMILTTFFDNGTLCLKIY